MQQQQERIVTINGHDYPVTLHPDVTCQELRDNIVDIFKKELDEEELAPPYSLWLRDDEIKIPDCVPMKYLPLEQPIHFGPTASAPFAHYVPLSHERFVRMFQTRVEQYEFQYAHFEEEQTEIPYPLQHSALIFGREGNLQELNYPPNTFHVSVAVQDYEMEQVPVGHISRDHAGIIYWQRRVYLAPLKNRNPIFRNGRQMPYRQAQVLDNGDVLQFGAEPFRVIFRQTPIYRCE